MNSTSNPASECKLLNTFLLLDKTHEATNKWLLIEAVFSNLA